MNQNKFKFLIIFITSIVPLFEKVLLTFQTKKETKMEIKKETENDR